MATLIDDKLKVPISKQLTDNLILPCIAITGVGLYDLYSTGQKRVDQNIVFIILFGIPTLLFAWFLIDKNVEFKDNKKVRKADRLFQLPFSSFSTLFIFIISSLFLVGGLAVIFGYKDISGGLPMLLIGLSAIVLTAIAVDHPKVWFSDTLNMDDMIEDIKNTPQENFPAYQDGIFSYSDNSFTIQLDKETKTINWDDIQFIKAYKIDQYMVDCIVIEIHLAETFITINDQTAGHMKFMDTAFNKLNNFKKDWFTVVAFPAFETNLTTVYERQTADEKNGSN
ncbi:MAG: hypothetical protein J0L87_10840 [Bacteroidetes bacterium]|nr:hypothetical protein [Bacteroidota bacterium]